MSVNSTPKTCDWIDWTERCGKPATWIWPLKNDPRPLCETHAREVVESRYRIQPFRITGNSVDGQHSAQAQDPR